MGFLGFEFGLFVKSVEFLAEFMLKTFKKKILKTKAKIQAKPEFMAMFRRLLRLAMTAQRENSRQSVNFP